MTIATVSRFVIFLGPKNNPGLFIALGMQIRFLLEPTQGYFWPWLLFGYHESYGRNALRKRFYHMILPNSVAEGFSACLPLAELEEEEEEAGDEEGVGSL